MVNLNPTIIPVATSAAAAAVPQRRLHCGSLSETPPEGLGFRALGFRV